jgi:hypothetical protein
VLTGRAREDLYIAADRVVAPAVRQPIPPA